MYIYWFSSERLRAVTDADDNAGVGARHHSTTTRATYAN